MTAAVVVLAFLAALVGWGWLATWHDRESARDEQKVLGDARVLPFRRRAL